MYAYLLYEPEMRRELGVFPHPSPDLGAGDSVALADGRVAVIQSRTSAPAGAEAHAVLFVLLLSSESHATGTSEGSS